MRIEPAALERLLHKFSGRLVTEEEKSEFKKFSLGFFPNNTIPTVHTDLPLDITAIHSNYQVYHKHAGSSFNAYLQYHLVKTMQQPEFTWLRYRYINAQWYCFDNLPLLVSVKIDDTSIQQVDFFLENVTFMPWREFVKAYREKISEHRATKQHIMPECISWYGVAHMVTNMPFNFSSYLPSQKENDYYAHAPWFVGSRRIEKSDGLYTTLSCTFSHASGLPSELDTFIKALKENLLKVPESQQITRFLGKGARVDRDEVASVAAGPSMPPAPPLG